MPGARAPAQPGGGVEMNMKHHLSTCYGDWAERRAERVSRPWIFGSQEAWERTRPAGWIPLGGRASAGLPGPVCQVLPG